MRAIATKHSSNELFPADTEVFAALLEHYGFDYFLKKTLPMIDIDDEEYGSAVDTALDRYNVDYDATNFSVAKVFSMLLRDLLDEGYTNEEAIEELAEDGYVIPVNAAMYYSFNAGDSDIELLSSLIRNRARKLLRKQRSN